MSNSVRSNLTPAPSVSANDYVRKWRSHERVSPARVITSDQMAQLAQAFLGSRWLQDVAYSLYPSDLNYYCPPIAEAKEIIHSSFTYRQEYVRNNFDCDDFAYVLKAHFCEAAFAGGAKQLPYCFGIVWGQSPKHALNWMINDDLILRLVEPQKPASEAIVPLENYADFYLAMI